MLIKWYSQLEVNKASNVVGSVGVAGVSSGCCDSPEKWLELCITKRILRPFAAHAYISAQIVIRGPSEPTKPTKPTTRQTWPTWPTFRTTDQAVTWFCISGNGKADENVMRSFYKAVRGDGREGGGWVTTDSTAPPRIGPTHAQSSFGADLWLTSRWWTAAGAGHFLSLPQPTPQSLQSIAGFPAAALLSRSLHTSTQQSRKLVNFFIPFS